MRIKKSLCVKKSEFTIIKKPVRFPEHLRCSSVPSKTQSFHQFSVNFVKENKQTFHPASKRMNFANFASLKHNENKKTLRLKQLSDGADF